MFARCAVQSLVSGLLAISIGINPLGITGARFMCLLRGALGSLGNFLLLYAVSRIPMADANTIFFTNPIFTVIYATCLLHEPTARVEVASLIMGFTGVILVMRPTTMFNSLHESPSPITESPLALAACILGAAVSGLVPIIVRRIGESVNHLCLVFYFGITGTLLATTMLLTGVQPLTTPASAESFKAFSLLALICVLGLGTQFTFNKAMQIEKPQVCAVLRSLNVAFTFMWQQVGTADPTSSLSIMGACLIVSSTVAVLLSKIIRAGAGGKPQVESGSVQVYGRE
ncbi:Transmembrane protein, putative [Perkinsus marinus ATCC 50983]|uniref:Transmembrane protein, putative n=1 Tax=Perkinsus marinus (strain ATCC 50983 / TXsc) TaxID=423536 RepID=C5K4G2_PERM5|nr:Transmembrane protein, putative [Perkinsus marinus ATCC 50983]EER20655.1 Transmembrane protein, putative [Perkinsus marinus ATCC 50983]|eukprot:XP_002788859.1 Transmembrane protein, putative [Perkinsus marinus ATCC 50983]